MKRLRNIGGGMPLRLDDFVMIQDDYRDALSSVILSLLNGETSCIIKGFEVDYEGGTINYTEGYIFVENEVFYVPAVSFAQLSPYLYLVPDFTTQENRVFQDTSENDVYDIRQYSLITTAELPEEGLDFTRLLSLSDGQVAFIQDSISELAVLKSVTSIAYQQQFSAATAFDGISIQKNSINGCLVQAAFLAEVATGKIGVLPQGLRPSSDLVGFFFNGSVAPGILKVKKNGDMYVSGASLVAENYITFQFYLDFDDTILFTLPVIGGTPVPGGDES
ncbi:MAG TPA: hypothetical protein P5531_10510 [Bacteroidales bacterium]|nr:hypothetical protein [Bacteroidales bacterium]HSA43606.1 hypothetical protein [Bacteroidales bacterium]